MRRHSVKPAVKSDRSRLLFAGLAALALACLSAGRGAAADKDSAPKKVNIAALEKSAPETIDDLKAIQQQVKEVLKKVIPCTVGLQVGGAAGSGVIIDKEGHV